MAEIRPITSNSEDSTLSNSGQHQFEERLLSAEATSGGRVSRNAIIAGGFSASAFLIAAGVMAVAVYFRRNGSEAAK